MKYCFICGCETNKPVVAFFYHFRLWDSESFPYFEGNRRSFGLWTAIKSCVPIFQIRTMWLTRGKVLKFPVSCDNDLEK